jgi:hypothetical protein
MVYRRGVTRATPRADGHLDAARCADPHNPHASIKQCLEWTQLARTLPAQASVYLALKPHACVLLQTTRPSSVPSPAPAADGPTQPPRSAGGKSVGSAYAHVSIHVITIAPERGTRRYTPMRWDRSVRGRRIENVCLCVCVQDDFEVELEDEDGHHRYNP